MTDLPEFWRTEVFHPLSVHFPIVLLLLASLFKLISLWSSKMTWDHGGRVLLFLGVIGVWISIYTGDLADGIVSRKLCDPTVLKEHENLAYTTAWIFSIALLIEIIISKIDLFKTRVISVLLVILMLSGSVIMAYVGHLGAELVYQQAAGVNIPSSDCAEFN
ncbi:DUF2231 domain-containing protein [Christiangramia sabulilitoris]|uniref:DUF2231 domain-containing protein n=1 Tax=Christiangramia sabulilitoris TaxID=2583991 RepID=A0A550I709_9FLAO|nr:DUF2231 domain-containing protein [Christiangramia sabulilitoris]TRO66762.1 hypothetical protein FGM01_02405 [Christiangramia sabulilitoris]